MAISEKVNKKYAILIIGFNRPNHLAKVIQALPQNRVHQLYISIDGPRNEQDKRKIQSIETMLHSQNLLFSTQINFHEKNLGCALGVISAIDWFFENADQGIILEDDCIPNQQFFDFVDNHKEEIGLDTGIGMLSAHNPLNSFQNHDYLISSHSFINGWYSRSDVWKAVRKDIFLIRRPLWLRNRKNKIQANNSIFWWATATRARLGTHDTWDSPFSDQMKRLQLKCFLPGKNLVENIGFGEDATHTQDPNGTIFAENLFLDPKLNEFELDSYLDKYYFRIRRRHVITPFLKILLDLRMTSRIDQEQILLEARQVSRNLTLKGLSN